MNNAPSNGQLPRRLARRLMRLYYPVIEVSHRERIPRSGPVLFVANHPNSLLDPPVIGWVTQRPVHFYAKAPLFELPVLGGLLRAVGMVPAYRGADGPAQVRRNLETLRAGAAYLVRGEAVGIFPEGKSHDLTRVEMIRSGAARIALEAAAEGAAVTVVPMGLNYERKERFRSSVWVRVGRPLDVAGLMRAEGGETRKALRSLTHEIERRLREVVVHLDDPQFQPFLHELEVLLPPPREAATDPIPALRQRKRIADAMNHWLAADRPRAEAMASAMRQHRARLEAHGLGMDSLLIRTQGATLFWRSLAGFLGLLPTLVATVAGVVHHVVPFLMARQVVRWRYHAGRTWLAVYRLLFSLPIYACWYGLVFWALATWLNAWVAALWSAAMPPAGVIALRSCDRLAALMRLWGQEARMALRPRRLAELRIEHARLRREVQAMAEQYRLLRGTGSR
ncbi:MAG: 1-acyl-sn-glycerol-3-phosphate acyltransferase [Verrucomicrobiales bacterium]|nr:1-acyl-sn-glycerol-3-phosphate acyltransferase [Verrucomicrobiales bacterium]